MRHAIALTVSVALSIATAACGSSEPDAASAQSAAASAQSAAVAVVDFAFAPQEIVVPAGTTVTWTNQDTFAHTVTAGEPNQPSGAFDQPLGDTGEHAAAGSTGSVTFDEPGTYAYFCDLHPSMTGTVVVEGA